MRLVILNTDYPEFLRWLYAAQPGLEHQSYAEQMRVRSESLFGVADFYSSNLRKLGHEAWDIHANNESMQKAWAREHGMPVKQRNTVRRDRVDAVQWARAKLPKARVRYLKPILSPVLQLLDRQQAWFYEILTAQIRHYRPDVLLNQSMDGIGCRYLNEMRPDVRLLLGQHAATVLAEGEDYRCYDAVLSSFPPTVDYFRQRGVPAERHRLAFEPQVLSSLQNHMPPSGVSFVGTLQRVHTSRTAWLETLCQRDPQTMVWAPEIERVSAGSPVRRCYRGQAWGREMYQSIRDSAVTLNHHGDVLPNANNMRLFEATGVGTLLLTDWKEDLHELFEPGREVVTYRSPEECAELIRYYLDHEAERDAISRAGQARTLRDHTYAQRMQELVDIVQKYL